MLISNLKNNFQKYFGIKSVLCIGNINTELPLYSILIPTFKRPEFLKQSIDSIVNQINISDYEIIVVDNECESNDYINSLINSYNNNKIFYYKNSVNIGMIGNWNRCVELARGKWITFLHDDDILLPHYLLTVNKILKLYPKINFLAPSAIIGKDPKNIEEGFFNTNQTIYKLNISDFFFENPVPTQGTILLKEYFVKLGGFNEEYFPGSDYAFWINYICNYGGFKISNKLVFYRISENESRKPETIENIIRISYFIRNELITLTNYPNILLHIYNNFFFFHQIEMSNKYMNTRIRKVQFAKAQKVNIIYNIFFLKSVYIKLLRNINFFLTIKRKHQLFNYSILR